MKNNVFPINSVKYKKMFAKLCLIFFIFVLFIFARFGSENILYGPDTFYIYFGLTLSIVLMILFPVINFVRKRDILEPINLFMVIYVTFYFFKFIDILANGVYRYGVDTNDFVVSKAIFLSNVGILSFYIGYFMLSPTRSTKQVHKHSIFNVKWRKVDVSVVSFIFILFGVLGASVLMYKKAAGSFTLAQRALYMRGSGFCFLTTFFFSVGVLIWCVDRIKRNTEYTKKVKTIILAILFLVPYVVFLGSRGNFFIFFMAILILYHYCAKKINLKFIILLTVMFLIFAVGFHNFRKSGRTSDIFIINRTFTSCNAFFHELMRSFCGTEGFLQVLSRNIPKTYGIQYLSVITIYIPRFLWPDKPALGIGLYFTNYMYPTAHAAGTTYGTSLLGSLYLTFGLWAVVLGMFLLGVILRLSYNWFLKYSGNKSILIVYAVLVPIICLKAISQAFSTMIAFLPQVLLPLFLGILLLSTLKKAVTKEN